MTCCAPRTSTTTASSTASSTTSRARSLAHPGRFVVVGMSVMATIVLGLWLIENRALWATGDVHTLIAAGPRAWIPWLLGVLALGGAVVSHEAVMVRRRLLGAPAGGALPLPPGGDDDEHATSAAAVPTLALAVKKPAHLVERSEDLDEETAWEVLRSARRNRPLFGTVWFFFVAAPFLVMAIDNHGMPIGESWLLTAFGVLSFSGFVVGTPVVVFTQRQAFLAECEQLGIARPLARRLWWRLTMASLLYSLHDEADERAVARLRGLPPPSRSEDPGSRARPSTRTGPRRSPPTSGI